MTAYKAVNKLLYPQAGAGTEVKNQPVYVFTFSDINSGQFLGDFSIYRSRYVKIDNQTDVPVRINIGTAIDFANQAARDRGTLTDFNDYAHMYVLPGQSIVVEKKSWFL